MKWIISAVASCALLTGPSNAFVSQAAKFSSIHQCSEMNNLKSPAFVSKREMSTFISETDLDTVTVDLSDGRDYPIYIGADFDDKEGKIIQEFQSYSTSRVLANFNFRPILFSFLKLEKQYDLI